MAIDTSMAKSLQSQIAIFIGNGKESECHFYLGSSMEMENQLKKAMLLSRANALLGH
jgi:hypothetical protein